MKKGGNARYRMSIEREAVLWATWIYMGNVSANQRWTNEWVETMGIHLHVCWCRRNGCNWNVEWWYWNKCLRISCVNKTMDRKCHQPLVPPYYGRNDWKCFLVSTMCIGPVIIVYPTVQHTHTCSAVQLHSAIHSVSFNRPITTFSNSYAPNKGSENMSK